MNVSRSVLLNENEAGGLHAARLPKGWVLEESKAGYCYQLTNGETCFTLLMGYGGQDRANVMITKTGPWEEMRLVNKASLVRQDGDWSMVPEWFSKVLSAELPVKEGGEPARLRCGERACEALQEVFDLAGFDPDNGDLFEVYIGGLSFVLKDPEGGTAYFPMKTCPFCAASVQKVPVEFFYAEEPGTPGL